MSAAVQTPAIVKPVSSVSKRIWAGRVVSALPVLLLLFSGVMKLMKPASVVEGFARYGYAEHLILILGLLEIGCTILYLIPRTAVLGAILVTAYLGGATATNVRVADPSFLVTVALGILAWVGLYLRDERLRDLVPFRN